MVKRAIQRINQILAQEISSPQSKQNLLSRKISKSRTIRIYQNVKQSQKKNQELE
jgi:hypothetical protein